MKENYEENESKFKYLKTAMTLTLPGVREKSISLAPDWTGFSLVLSA